MIAAEEFAQQESNAQLSLAYELQDGRSVLTRREHYGPLLVQKPFYPEGDAVCHTILVHPPGGIVAGDRLRVNLIVAADAHALVTTPGATKWYRSEGAFADQHVKVKLADGARLEWLPQEAIVFNRAQARQTISVDLTGDACYLGWDILMLGRTAAQEKFSEGIYQQVWQVTRDGVPLWLERGQLNGASSLMAAPAGLAGCSVTATLIAVGNAWNAALVGACRAIPAGGDARVAVTALPQVLSVRYLGHRVEDAKRYLQSVWRELRPHYFGRMVQTPRIWST